MALTRSNNISTNSPPTALKFAGSVCANAECLVSNTHTPVNETCNLDGPMPESVSILIVEDEPLVSRLIESFLSDRYRCVCAYSAEEALEILHEDSFALVLTDIQMGEMSGLEMIPRILESAPDTLIVISSALETADAAINALRAGAYDYITKPLDLKKLDSVVRRALDLYELRLTKRIYDQRLEALVGERTAELHKTNQTLRALVSASPLAIITSDRDGTVKSWNPAAVRIFGRLEEESLSVPLSRLAGVDTGEPPDWFLSTIRGENGDGLERRFRRQDGTAFDAGVWTATTLDQDGAVNGMMAVVADVTQRKQAEAKIYRLAYHDPLTGLPNRTRFEERVTAAVEAAGRTRRPLCVMFLSLDRLKQVNDTLGHETGDRFLKQVADRLGTGVGEQDLLARFGSDEFSLLLFDTDSSEEAADYARRLQRLLQAPFEVEGRELYVTASIGIDLLNGAGKDAGVLLKNACAALYLAKQQGGDNYQFFTEEVHASAVRRLALENYLRRAVERDELMVYYQPRVRCDTEEIVGMEALIRWRHAELGNVSPGEFIPVAEETGMIVPIGEWVLRSACRQNRAWQEAGLPPLTVSVNISPRQFRQPNLPEKLKEILEETGLEPCRLELELTEGCVMRDAEESIVTLQKLKAMGLKLSIDDFGSGYSSLTYLKRFPIDALKIDQSFVRDTTSDPASAAIVMAVITLGHSLNLQVVAEGVETDEQMRFLRLLRCDQLQGYLFGRPLPAEEFAAIFR